jgi:hypothetical protein
VTELQTPMQRECFIPVRLSVLRESMLADPYFSTEEVQSFQQLFEIMTARFHFEFLKILEKLKEAYSPFDQDRETRCDPSVDETTRTAAYEHLCEGFNRLLIHGNYRLMPQEKLQEYLIMQPFAKHLSVAVDPNEFDDVRVYYRDLRQEEFDPPASLTKKLIAKYVKKKPLPKIKVGVFSRVALLARLSDEHVVLKLFKDIKCPDLKIISPHPRIVMTKFQTMKSSCSLVIGLATTIFKLFVASLNPIVFLAIAASLIGAGVRSVTSFFFSRTKYMQKLSSRLYFQCLANNTTVLTRLVDSGEEEEIKEILLAYFMLYKCRDIDLTEDELDERVEQWILEKFGCDVDFEVDDARRKLEEKELLVARTTPASDGGSAREILKVYDLRSALRRMDEIWDNYFPFSNLSEASEDCLAE